MTELTKSEQLLIRTCYKVLERASKLKAERDDARRQAATYAAHIEDLSGQIDLWRERALTAFRKYHETRHERDRLKAGLTVAKEENYEARRKAGRLKKQRNHLARFNAAANDALSLLMEGCVEAATEKGLEALNMVHDDE